MVSESGKGFGNMESTTAGETINEEIVFEDLDTGVLVVMGWALTNKISPSILELESGIGEGSHHGFQGNLIFHPSPEASSYPA